MKFNYFIFFVNFLEGFFYLFFGLSKYFHRSNSLIGKKKSQQQQKQPKKTE